MELELIFCTGIPFEPFANFIEIIMPLSNGHRSGKYLTVGWGEILPIIREK